ncbi:MAG: HAD hydrolase-like protein, partial [Campylobacterota bacterium]|nr:HAD hydrolase-like protein [Campylobacterota bacterium]
MNFTNKELIIFDLDGTLIDSVPDLASSVNHTLKSLNLD